MNEKVLVRFSPEASASTITAEVLAYVGVPGSGNEAGHVQAVVKTRYGYITSVYLDRISAVVTECPLCGKSQASDFPCGNCTDREHATADMAVPA